MRLPRFILLASLMTIVALPVFAQQLTGKVVVTVLDETGQPFPGVVVQLSNTRALAPTNALRTNAQGKAVFGVVPSGSGYKVTIEMAGFAKQEEDSISVGSSKTVALLFSLQMSAIEEEIEVTGVRPLPTDLDTNPGSMTMSGEFFEDLPILGRSYQSALTLAPGVGDDDEDGNPNVHGARERDFKVTVDGVSNVDPLTGTFMSNINPDAIEEIEIITEGADASYGRAVGGFGKIITKQGSNEHEGVFKMYYRSDLFDGNGATSRPDSEFEFDLYQPSVSLTGPIMRDKLFYALNHEYVDRGDPINLVSGGGLVVEQEAWRHLDKITWQVTPRNKLNFQYSADPLTAGPLAIGNLTNRRSGLDYEQGGPTYSMTWQAPVNANFTVTSLAAFSDTGIEIKPLSTQIRNECVTDQLASQRIPSPIDRDYCTETRTSRTSGGYFRTYEDDRQRLTLKSDATWYISDFLGKEHNVDFGFVLEDESFEDQQVNYPFSIFREVRVQRFLVFGGGAAPPELASSGTLNRTVFFPSGPEPLKRTAEGQTIGLYLQDTFRPHPTVSIKAGLRMEREEVDAPGFEVFDPEEEGKLYEKFYKGILTGDQAIMDQIPDPQLRQDCQGAAGNGGTSSRCAVFTLSALGKPMTRAQFLCDHRQATGSPDTLCDPVLQPHFQDQEPTSFTIKNTNLSPSVSVSWDPGGNGRTRLYSTFSRKYDKIFLAIPIWEQGPDSLDDTYSVFEDSNNAGQFIISNSNSNAQSTPTVNQVDRNLRTPYVNEFTAGFAREIAPEMSMTLTYIRRHFKDQFQDIDANHFTEDLGNNKLDCIGSMTPQGLPVFTAQGKPDGQFDDCGGLTFFLPTRVGGTGRIGSGFVLNERPDGIPDLKLHSPLFNQVFTIGNYNETEYEAYKLEILRRLRNNWEMESSYVWSEAVGNAEDFAQALGDDPSTVSDETGFLSFDLRHVVKVNVRRIVPVWNMNVGIVARWQSGYPYSNTELFASSDRIRDFGGFTRIQTQTRTTYPSGQRNDRRNESWYNVDLNAQKHFTVGKTSMTASAEIFNVLNDDALRVVGVQNGNAFLTRRFGRQFQTSLKVNF